MPSGARSRPGIAARMRKPSPGVRGFAGCRVLSWSATYDVWTGIALEIAG